MQADGSRQLQASETCMYYLDLKLRHSVLSSRLEVKFISENSKWRSCILQDNGQKSKALKFLCSSSLGEKLNDRRMLDISARKIIDDFSQFSRFYEVLLESKATRDRGRSLRFLLSALHFLDTCHQDGRRESPRQSVVLWKSWQKQRKESEMFYNYYGCPIRSTHLFTHLHLH